MKRWTVDTDGDLWWSEGPLDPGAWALEVADLDVIGFGQKSVPAHAALVAAVHDAGRLRSLAATLDDRLNREQKFTGAQVAAMLRDGEG